MVRDRVRAALAAAAVLLACATARAAPAGGKYALLVGVRQYDRSELRSLKYTENDVTALAELLRGNGYDRVVLMTQTAGAERATRLPTAGNVRDELRAVLDGRQPGDTVLLAFTGHGVQFKGEDENYFCPMDARLGDRKTLISLTEVYAELKSSKAGVKVLLIDACRNDPASDLAKDTGGERLESVTKPQLRAAPGGVAALFSCSAGERSYESDDLRHGIFFHHVLEALRGKAANSDGTVGFEELASYAKRKVPDYVKDDIGPRARQTPHSVNDSVGGMVLAGGATPRETRQERPPAATPPETRQERPPAATLPDPSTLTSYRGRDGQTFSFAVTGKTSGSVWGNGPYTDDSSLATAAVHAGVLREGELGVVKVTIGPGLSGYVGSNSNGVNSLNYSSFPGSFSIVGTRRFGPRPGEVAPPLPDPGSLSSYRGRDGQSFRFAIIGKTSGRVYGSGPYTDDSSLATAAVHAGVLRPGEVGIVKVTIVAGQPNYLGTTRNGVASSIYGSWDGSYTVESGGRGAVVLPDPGTLYDFREWVGRAYWFKVIGKAEGTLYGSGPYTDDSSLATAAVHAGILRVGEIGYVKVTILGNQTNYVGSTRNGVTSSSYSSYSGYAVESLPGRADQGQSKAAEAPRPPAGAAPTLFDVEWNGAWYPATILRRDGDKVFVRYDGYEDKWDEWVPLTRVRLRQAK